MMYSDAMISFRHYVLEQPTHGGHGGAGQNEEGKQDSA